MASGEFGSIVVVVTSPGWLPEVVVLVDEAGPPAVVDGAAVEVVAGAAVVGGAVVGAAVVGAAVVGGCVEVGPD